MSASVATFPSRLSVLLPDLPTQLMLPQDAETS